MTQGGIVTSDPVTDRKRRRAVGLGPIVLASLVMLVAGWSLLWLFASHEAGRGFDAWVALERSQGRIWTCKNRNVGGYPLAIVLRCDSPTIADAASDGAVHGTLASFSAEAKLYDPTRVTVTLTGPLAVEDGDAAHDLQVSWSAAHLALRGTVGSTLDRASLQAEALAIMAPAGFHRTTLGHVELDVRPRSAQTVGDIDAEIALTIDDGTSPEIDEAFKGTAPFQGSAKALLTDLKGEGATLAQLLEPWRRDGGRIQLQAFRFIKGGFTAEGDGQFGLDDDHRIAGQLNARFVGLEPLAARFGIPLGAVQIGGLLSGLLGGKAPRDASGGADLSLQLNARSGRLFVGPIKTGVTLQPLY